MTAAVNRFVIDPVQTRFKRLRKTVLTTADWMKRECDGSDLGLGRSGFRWLFVTLTYRRVGEWEPGHISDYIRHCREWFGRRGHAFRFVWVAELQKRGALHYHVLVAVPRGERLPSPDLTGWWPHGWSNVQTARKPVGYLAKYASKFTPENGPKFPKGVRLHGSGGLSSSCREAVRAHLRPKWVRSELLQRWADEQAQRQADEDHYHAGYAVDAGACTAEEAAAWWAAEHRRRDEEYARDLEREAVEEFERFERLHEVAARGRCAVRRVCGGYVDVVEGAFFPTPFVVGNERVEEADGSVRRVWVCEDRSALRYPVSPGATVEGDRPGERWKLAAGYVPRH